MRFWQDHTEGAAPYFDVTPNALPDCHSTIPASRSFRSWVSRSPVPVAGILAAAPTRRNVRRLGSRLVTTQLSVIGEGYAVYRGPMMAGTLHRHAAFQIVIGMLGRRWPS